LSGPTLTSSTSSVLADVLNAQGTFAYNLIPTNFAAATHNSCTGDSGGPGPVPEPVRCSFALAAAVTRLFFRK
jgi:hypothetical protein